VRELKGFQKVTLQPGEQRKLSFQLTTRDLAFWNGEMEFTAEPGEFHVWIAQDSTCNGLPPATFRLV
jgi:beta-glucosidase